MTLILLLIACAAAFAWWNAARAATERAGELGRNACEAAGVQWLDHSVHAIGTRLRRDELGRLRFERTFRFDYSHDGSDRAGGARRQRNRAARDVRRGNGCAGAEG